MYEYKIKYYTQFYTYNLNIHMCEHTNKHVLIVCIYSAQFVTQYGNSEFNNISL